jgi:hypothetical protein
MACPSVQYKDSGKYYFSQYNNVHRTALLKVLWKTWNSIIAGNFFRWETGQAILKRIMGYLY